MYGLVSLIKRTNKCFPYYPQLMQVSYQNLLIMGIRQRKSDDQFFTLIKDLIKI